MLAKLAVVGKTRQQTYYIFQLRIKDQFEKKVWLLSMAVKWPAVVFTIVAGYSSIRSGLSFVHSHWCITSWPRFLQLNNTCTTTMYKGKNENSSFLVKLLIITSHNFLAERRCMPSFQAKMLTMERLLAQLKKSYYYVSKHARKKRKLNAKKICTLL